MEADRHQSPAPKPAGTVFEEHYDRLVRIAYLVGPRIRCGTTGRARAHRMVQRCLPLRSRATLTYRDLVARVVRRAARPRRWTLPALVPWARPTPLPGDRGHRIMAIVLGAAPAPVRAAYVLLNVERMPAREVVLTLHAAGWGAGVAHVAAATALRQRLVDEYGLDVAQQRALLAEGPTDPTLARLRAPRPDSLRALRIARWGGVAVATAVAATLVAAPLLIALAEGRSTTEAVGAWVTPEPTPPGRPPGRGAGVDEDQRADTRQFANPRIPGRRPPPRRAGGDGLSTSPATPTTPSPRPSAARSPPPRADTPRSTAAASPSQ